MNSFDNFVKVIKTLRGPKGCPWDLQQTHETLTPFAIEEAHELVEAIELGSDQKICEELGDLLFQVVLHSVIAEQRGSFCLEDVIQNVTQKMIRRHPHVFNSDDTSKSIDASAVRSQWEAIKAQENIKTASKNNDVFAQIPESLPALQRAQKIGDKTVRYNFDWSSAQEVFLKVEEEIKELKETLLLANKTEQKNELGDVLFTLAQLARHLELDAEQSLRSANRKFVFRFSKVRELIQKDKLDIKQLNFNQLEGYWQKAKKA